MPKTRLCSFAVGSDVLGALSSVWNIWERKGNVMGTARGLGGPDDRKTAMKFTLHLNGHCHVAEDQRHATRRQKKGSGQERWKPSVWLRAEGPLHTAVPAFKVAMPGAFLRQPKTVQQGITWIDPPGRSEAAWVVLAFTRADTLELRGWKQLLFEHGLPNGEHVIGVVISKPFDAVQTAQNYEKFMKETQMISFDDTQIRLPDRATLRGLGIDKDVSDPACRIITDLGSFMLI